MAHTMSLAESRHRAERAYNLRCMGRSWRTIARELGYQSTGAVVNAVNRHAARTEPDAPEQSRRQLVEGVRATASVLFDRFAVAADQGDDKTLVMIDGALNRKLDIWAKLTGAYMPERSEVDVRADPGTLVADFFAALQRPGARPVMPRLVSEVPIEAEVIE